MVNSKIRLIIFFAAKDGEALYSQQKQDWELTVTQIMNSLLPKYKLKLFSRVPLFATPWTVAYQAFPSMGFSRQEYHSGLPFPSPGELPDPGIKPTFPALQADSLPSVYHLSHQGSLHTDTHIYVCVS